MLESIRTYFFEKEKNKRIRNSPPVKMGYHRNRKNHYGLLVDAANPDDRNVAIAFAEALRKEGNRVKILGFVDGRKESVVAIPSGSLCAPPKGSSTIPSIRPKSAI